MAKNKAKQRSDRLFQSLAVIAGREAASGLPDAHRPEAQDGDENTDSILSIKGQEVQVVPDSTRLPRMKKFRFQLLHQWLVHNFPPCRAADIGGGKGLLGFLLMQSGWQATVIDPVPQVLPDKFKDILRGTRVKIDPVSRVPNIPAAFEAEHAAGFDLLIGMHAHGCNVKIIEAAARYGCGFVIFPCCVIDEPFYPPLGVHWLESLADYAVQQGHRLQPFRLNFKGQNIGLVSFGRLVR